MTLFGYHILYYLHKGSRLLLYTISLFILLILNLSYAVLLKFHFKILVRIIVKSAMTSSEPQNKNTMSHPPVLVSLHRSGIKKNYFSLPKKCKNCQTAFFCFNFYFLLSFSLCSAWPMKRLNGYYFTPTYLNTNLRY